MDLTYELRGNILHIYLSGEIDHHNAKSVRTSVDALIDEVCPGILCLDLSGITFCDSSGLGLVMGRIRKMDAAGGRVIVSRPSASVSRILSLAGMDRLIKIEA